MLMLPELLFLMQEVRDITGTWRLRVPNEWEPLTHWYDVLVWRNHIYNVIITNFRHLAEINPQLHQLGYRDKAWSVNKLGGIATTHGLPDTCLNILNTMYAYSAMEVRAPGEGHRGLGMPDLTTAVRQKEVTSGGLFVMRHRFLHHLFCAADTPVVVCHTRGVTSPTHTASIDVH
jgi:transformation/transcription domain-associated protein